VVGALVGGPFVVGLVGAGGDDGPAVFHVAEDQEFAQFAAGAFGDYVVLNFCHGSLFLRSRAVVSVL
jgi:hypothetical protein